MKNLQHNLPLQRILKNPLSSVNPIFPILLHNFSNRFWRIVKPKKATCRQRPSKARMCVALLAVLDTNRILVHPNSAAKSIALSHALASATTASTTSLEGLILVYRRLITCKCTRSYK
ncbi:hypothetical protein E1A91_A06G124700v1 [Gossypium mustelinum]|uniref:Uncharacterized protein n=1 Tax=Gossypium mustelinum TaxID=34275 RepID=A0A5D2YWQ4_GOSMU|nr:hypothetical protein E1A91_A06G124700v1 [Gossypium mustelinum]TYJ30347.1 hypothetical protein E1A91_A06G124700v1 [Gossypium mustelinum]TYJ30348.1 hypothetical protein E1A91_A06G124700v1 [Gossypium mustelinum]